MVLSYKSNFNISPTAPQCSYLCVLHTHNNDETYTSSVPNLALSVGSFLSFWSEGLFVFVNIATVPESPPLVDDPCLTPSSYSLVSQFLADEELCDHCALWWNSQYRIKGGSTSFTEYQHANFMCTDTAWAGLVGSVLTGLELCYWFVVSVSSLFLIRCTGNNSTWYKIVLILTLVEFSWRII